ncbi:hypothetical protein C8Q80DRAFT_1266580 [Daedaleopsis nitida]|nr:hypothetical protein C8Q80DRAFT_1266580 [Daedaleopsis nitida]
MSFLSTSDLSALTRTCRVCRDIGLLPLCGRSGKAIKSGKALLSFFDFLRIDSETSSRASLIKDLWIHNPYDPCHNPSMEYNDAQNAVVLNILRNCGNIRRLRIDCRFGTSLPSPLLLQTISTSLLSLADLTILTATDLDEEALSLLTGLSLQRFLLMTPTLPLVKGALLAIQPLASTLVELEIQKIPPGSACFPNVRKLSVWMEVRRADFVDALATTFPEVTHLTIGTNVISHSFFHSPGSARIEDGAVREANQGRWRKHPQAFKALQAVCARQVQELYCLGLSRPVAFASLPLQDQHTSFMLPLVLANLVPRHVELRVFLDHCFVTPAGLDLVHDAYTSLRRLTLHIDYHGMSSSARCMKNLRGLLRSFARGLPDLPLTHLHLRCVYKGAEDVLEEMATMIWKDAPARVKSLSRASRSLCWVGVELQGWGLRCWEIRRPSESSEAEIPDSKPAPSTAGPGDQKPTLVETDEWTGRRVLETEGMMAYTGIPING